MSLDNPLFSPDGFFHWPLSGPGKGLYLLAIRIVVRPNTSATTSLGDLFIVGEEAVEGQRPWE